MRREHSSKERLQAAGSREAWLTGRKLQQLVHVNLVMSPERFKFLFHDIGDTDTQNSPVNQF